MCQTKVIKYCKLKAINSQKSTHNIAISPILVSPPNSLDELSSSYNKSLEHVLDTHAPICSATITVRHNCQWFNDELLTAKHHSHKLKLIKNQSCLTVYAQIFDAVAKMYRANCDRAKLITTNVSLMPPAIKPLCSN